MLVVDDDDGDGIVEEALTDASHGAVCQCGDAGALCSIYSVIYTASM